MSWLSSACALDSGTTCRQLAPKFVGWFVLSNITKILADEILFVCSIQYQSANVRVIVPSATILALVCMVLHKFVLAHRIAR